MKKLKYCEYKMFFIFGKCCYYRKCDKCKDNGAYTEQHRLDIKGGKFPDLAEEV